MRKFCVVHLSDLHIRAIEDPAFERVRQNIVDDINELASTNNLDINALVMTGDVVDKGGSEKAFEKAENFFGFLHSDLGLSKEQLLFVPGNHDVPRNVILSGFIDKSDYVDFEQKQEFAEYWSQLKTRLNNFDNFVRGFSGVNMIECDFGGRITTLSTPWGKVRFFLFNSAWATTGPKDYERLMIGKWQLEEMVEKNKQLENADLSIGLVHHPLDWYYKRESSLIRTYLTSSNLLPIDVLLHGHIHEGKIDLSGTPDGGLYSLVTGIGYPNQSIQNSIKDFGNCRYAVYEFDLDKNQIKVWLRVTRPTGEFAADTLLYHAGKENGQLLLPIKNNVVEKNIPKEVSETSQVILEFDAVPIANVVGRTDEMTSLLDRNIRAAAITGVGGQGKTALAAEMFRKYSRGSDKKFDHGVWIDCKELPDSLHFKIIQLLEVLTGGNESVVQYRDEKIEQTAKRLLRQLQERKILLVFDNIDAYVNEEMESAVGELQIILNLIMTNENESLVLLTCRPSLTDANISFRHIQLNGLSSKDAVNFFLNRGVEVLDLKEKMYCEKLVELTKGHPWWLGLIAGQIKSNKDTFRSIVEKFTNGEVTAPGRVSDYFGGIWNQLNEARQNLLRYLVESSRPLSEDEIYSAAKGGPKQIAKDLRRLERLGLLEVHETSSNRVYQVHPLLKQYVHESFSKEEQREYVHRILCLFIPRNYVDLLFNRPSAGNYVSADMIVPYKLVESIETCLNSRNESEALSLLERFGSLKLLHNGKHHQFRSLALRVFDIIDWEEEDILSRLGSMSLLGELLYILAQGSESDKIRGKKYLERIEFLGEHGTSGFSAMLSIKIRVAWLEGNYVEALQLCDEFERHASILDDKELWDPQNVKNSKALVLRDSGNYHDALELFIEAINDEPQATDFGNAANCLIRQSRFEEAERLLVNSLRMLLNSNSFYDRTNVGYAYLWLAETASHQDKYYESRVFIELVKNVWEECAPGLLDKAHELERIVEIKFNSPQLLFGDSELTEVENSYLKKYQPLNKEELIRITSQAM